MSKNRFVFCLLISLALVFGLKTAALADGCLPIDDDGMRIDYPALLFGCGLDELRVARNQFFAFYGYDFNDPHLKELFSRFSWYKPSADFDADAMSEDDKWTVDYIKKQEELLKRSPAKILFSMDFTLFKPEAEGFTLAYAGIGEMHTDPYGNEEYESYVFAVIPGMNKTDKEIIASWSDARFLTVADDDSFPVHANQVQACRLKKELVGEPHICIDLNGPSDDFYTLFIGWKDGEFHRTGIVEGIIDINDFSNDTGNTTKIFSVDWGGDHDINQVYIYDHESDLIAFSESIWPVFLDFACTASDKTFFYETPESAAGKTGATAGYFNKGEAVNVTLAECKEGYESCTFQINSYSRPGTKGWVARENLPCIIPAAD